MKHKPQSKNVLKVGSISVKALRTDHFTDGTPRGEPGIIAL